MTKSPLLLRIESRLMEEDHGMDPPCLVWQGSRNRASGYGKVRTPGDWRRSVVVHKAYYEETVGPVPEGHVLDHLCPESACVIHLEPVTQRVNVLRGIERHGMHYNR